ncbi:protein of unknown function [Candidatus Filomicrobium marinum]|nr:protein of unknown function [Candidatus Filomicrobium marinum]
MRQLHGGQFPICLKVVTAFPCRECDVDALVRIGTLSLLVTGALVLLFTTPRTSNVLRPHEIFRVNFLGFCVSWLLMLSLNH